MRTTFYSLLSLSLLASTSAFAAEEATMKEVKKEAVEAVKKLDKAAENAAEKVEAVAEKAAEDSVTKDVKASKIDPNDTKLQKDMQDAFKDRAAILADDTDQIVVGDADAPVTIIEYFSLSCPHCAEFYKTELPKLKEKYLDTGKAKLIMRHFPHNAPGVKAAQLVKCLPSERQHEFVKVLLKMQDSWAFTATYEDDLKTLAKVGGVSSGEFDRCMADEDAEKAMFDDIATVGKGLDLAGIPAFFVDGVQIKGGNKFSTLAPVIDKALADKE